MIAEALYPWGHQVLEVTTDVDGTVYVGSLGHEAHGCENEDDQGEDEGNDLPNDGNEDSHGEECGELVPGDIGSAPAACSDTFFDPRGYKENQTHSFFFNRGSTPTNLTADNAQTAITNGGQNNARANNDCGMADNVSASFSFSGDTNVTTNISSTGACQTGDSTSVVAFGSGGSTAIAIACTSVSGGDVVAGDIKLNKGTYSFTTGGTCSNKYDVEAVMTHERGHTLGFNDLNESAHGNLTMSGGIAACSTKERTLGKGDVLGLESKY